MVDHYLSIKICFFYDDFCSKLKAAGKSTTIKAFLLKFHATFVEFFQAYLKLFLAPLPEIQLSCLFAKFLREEMQKQDTPCFLLLSFQRL